MTTKRINLWSSPRNISTALMYSFAQRRNIKVVDEPLYAHYLLHSKSEAEHPGKEEILKSLEQDGKRVTEEMTGKNFKKEEVLFKQMTHHLINIPTDFLFKMSNVLLIRDPRRIIASYTKVIPNPTIADIGVKMQAELYNTLLAENALSAVVDAKQLLLNPAKVLKELCVSLEIPFESSMLSWTAGARPEDGVWAKYWYANVHRSTGFQPYTEKSIELSETQEELAKECEPYYARLFEAAIKA